MGSINKSHNEADGGILLFNGELILLYCDSVQCEIGGKESVKGRVYLTTHRLVMIITPYRQTSAVKSLCAPFCAITKCNVEQPIFGANYIEATVRDENDSSKSFSFKLRFSKGGAIEFAMAMNRAVAAVGRHFNPSQPPPPAYTPAPSAQYYQAPPTVYAPGYNSGVQMPVQQFPDQPPIGFIYASSAPPPYPGLGGGGAAQAPPPYSQPQQQPGGYPGQPGQGGYPGQQQQQHPGAGYPGQQQPGAGYPGHQQAPTGGYPGQQPPAGYPGQQQPGPTAAGYPGQQAHIGYPGQQPAPAAGGYPGQQAPSGYPSAQAPATYPGAPPAAGGYPSAGGQATAPGYSQPPTSGGSGGYPPANAPPPTSGAGYPDLSQTGGGYPSQQQPATNQQAGNTNQSWPSAPSFNPNWQEDKKSS